MTVRMGLPIKGWIKGLFARPVLAVAQAPTLQKWHAYLQQLSALP